MVNLQFVRGSEQEYLIDIMSDGKYRVKSSRIGYPMLSFIEDIEIDILAETTPHLYWGLSDVKSENMYTAKTVQKRFRDIFDALPKNGKMDLDLFEHAMIRHGLEIPTHTIAKVPPDGQSLETVCDIYRCISLPGTFASIVEQLCVAELYQIVKSGHIVKRCENCGKLFVPNKADEKYCIRASVKWPEKNCKQSVKYEKQLARERGSDAKKIYHSISTMLSKRAKDAPLSEREQAISTLINFRNDADEWKKRIKNGAAQESDFVIWLNAFKKRSNRKGGESNHVS